MHSKFDRRILSDPAIKFVRAAQYIAPCRLGGGSAWACKVAVGAVMKMSITGDKPAALAGTQNGPGRIVVDEIDAYWVSLGLWSNPTEEAKIMRLGLKGGPATVILPGTTYDYIAGFAMDASNVYWTPRFDLIVLSRGYSA